MILHVSGGDKAGRLPPESVQWNETVTAFIQVTQEICFDIRKLAQMAERSLNKREVSGSNPGHSILHGMIGFNGKAKGKTREPVRN